MMLLRSVLKRRISMSNGELYKGAFFEHFEGLVDTRQEGKVLHKLTDILFIVIAGVICGFDEWDDIHFWSEAPSNQEKLQEEVQNHFRELELAGELEKIQKQSQYKPFNGLKDGGSLGIHSTYDKGHGRIEKRTYFYSTDSECMVDVKPDWEKLTGFGKVIREVEYPADPTKKTIETAYYIASVNNVIDFATAARNHWGVESMHWSLDVTFGDDKNKTEERVAGQNLALVKRIAFNTLKNEKTIRPKLSTPKKRLNALLNTEYRDTLIDLNFKGR